MFALTGWWELCGGHVTLGSIIAFLIARIYFEGRKNFLGAVIACERFKRISCRARSRFCLANFLRSAAPLAASLARKRVMAAAAAVPGDAPVIVEGHRPTACAMSF